MANLIIDYNIENMKIYDKKENHILINNSDSKYSTKRLKSLIDSVEFAEVSIMINDVDDISSELVDLCITYRIILYWDLVSKKEFSSFPCLSNLDLVALIREENIGDLSEEILCEVVKSNLNLLVLLKEGNFQEISSVYERLLNVGFVKLFCLSYIKRLNYKETECFKLIGRQDIQKNNITHNISIKNQIEHLKQNVMKRYNRDRGNVNDNKLNICFVNANMYGGAGYKNLGIEYLASVLNVRGYCADCLYTDRLTMCENIEKIIEKNSIKVLGFSCMQDNVYAVQNIIKYLKRKYSDIVFMVGGAQAIDLGEKFMLDSGVDYIMVGESENYIVQLMDYVFYRRGNLEDVNNLSYINNEGIFKKNPRGALIDNLDNIPFPNYVFKRDDTLTWAGIITGRGCPFNCAFCFEGAKEKTVRYRSLDNVFEEITLVLKNNKNVKKIQLYDDTFTLNQKRLVDFCGRMKRLHDEFGITWICETHCQTVYDKPELIKMMVEAGMTGTQIGIESGNDEVLCKLNKKITSEMILKTVENCRNAGVSFVEGNIIVGAVGENRTQLEDNLKFAEKLLNTGRGVIEVNPVMFWPYPHTSIEAAPEKYGIKLLEKQIEYTMLSMRNCVSESETITRQELVEYYYLFRDQLQKIYKKIVSGFTRQEAEKHWKDSGFELSSLWGSALASIGYMRMFLYAKGKSDIPICNDDVYPVRSFDMLSYKDERIYIRETDILLELFDSRILELCNGKNTVKDIAKYLEADISVVYEHLLSLENRMLVYGTLF